MCTVSVIPTSHLGSTGYRLVSNRDESPLRARAESPAWHALSNGGKAMWPTDPEGQGTWVACSSTGLSLALLNRNDGPTEGSSPRRSATSRGGLIPTLISAHDLDEVHNRLRAATLLTFAPFRILGVNLRAGAIICREWVWDGSQLAALQDAAPPVCLASSGLGDSRVLPRLGLFSDLVEGNPGPVAQDAFHRHRWPDRPETSVLMERDGARTLSITTCDVFAGVDGAVSVSMDYTEVEAPRSQISPQMVRRGASV